MIAPPPQPTPSANDIRDLIDTLEKVHDLSEVAANSELVKATQGLEVLKNAHLTSAELVSLRGLEEFRLHPGFADAALHDFLQVLRVVVR